MLGDVEKRQALRSLENGVPKYEKFFEDVLNLYTGEGWYELKNTTKKRMEILKIEK